MLTDNINTIVNELGFVLHRVDQVAFEKLIELLASSQDIFVCGAGRSGLMGKSFAMRLVHLGYRGHVIGETTTPSFKEGDLLLVCSGSGETSSLVPIVQKAKRLGGKVGLITIDPLSTIAGLADLVIQLPAPSPKVINANSWTSIQPMGSLFEQSLLLLLDLVVLALMDRQGSNAALMYNRHANLE